VGWKKNWDVNGKGIGMDGKEIELSIGKDERKKWDETEKELSSWD
jgi:hypothetical protein